MLTYRASPGPTSRCSRRGRHYGFSWHEVFAAGPAAELCRSAAQRLLSVEPEPQMAPFLGQRGEKQMPETRFEAVKRILNTATDQITPGRPNHGGQRRFWDGTRDALVNAVVYGQQVIVLGKPEESALIKSLKGVAPFDGSQFPRMPLGRPPVNDSDIAFIAQWIRDNCPDSVAEAREKK